MNKRESQAAGVVLAAAIALLAACRPDAPTVRSPQARAPTVEAVPRVTPADAQRFDPLSFEVDAPSANEIASASAALPNPVRGRVDPNRGPVRVWIVEAQPGLVDAVYAVGHADGGCGRNALNFLTKGVNEADPAAAWLVYGIVEVHARGVEAKQEQLTKLSHHLGFLAKKQPSCQFQLEKTTLTYDMIAARTTKLVETAERLFQKAEEAQRPILLWHNLEGVPRFVPVTVRASPRSLELKLPVEQLKIPPVLETDLTVGGEVLKNPLQALVDAFLRGVPATFRDADRAKEYDGWVKAEQDRVWGLLRSQLEDADSTLLLSNVAFRVSVSGERSAAADLRELTIVPVFVTAGQTFQVADVTRGVVRYESADADQNLR